MNSIIKKCFFSKKQTSLFLFQASNSIYNCTMTSNGSSKYQFLDIPKKSYMLNQIRGKKNKKKKERTVLTNEQKAVKLKVPPIRLEDRTTVCEPASVISKNIKKEIMKLCIGKDRTKRHFKYRNKYKIRKILNLTHDKENIKDKKNPSTFITPLTKLQHESTLPRTLNHDRFTFPHSLHYSVTSHGSSIVDHEENNICFFSSNLKDLVLSSKEKKKLVEILGPERVHSKNELIYLESNFFNTYNHNAAYLGDAVQLLMNKIKTL
ncbi:mitochondrial ribosomal protein S35 precursor, putative [Hepatocystis sp. ex Piliocolobus tephrosceles]|nr:mitochondrial ribosomal protein S35 precursor, putative [Hepatocystis sp. ex Piliocolobus tephrosceles]